MLNISGIDHLNIKVKNIEETTKYYQDLFDFKVHEQGVRNGHRWAIIGKHDAIFLAIYEHPDHFKEENEQSLGHFGIVVKNFDQALELIAASDYEIDYPYDYPQSKSIYLTDPNGHEIELTNKFGGGN